MAKPENCRWYGTNVCEYCLVSEKGVDIWCSETICSRCPDFSSREIKDLNLKPVNLINK